MIAKKIGLPEEKVGKDNNLANRLFFPCLVKLRFLIPMPFFFFITNVLYFSTTVFSDKRIMFYINSKNRNFK